METLNRDFLDFISFLERRRVDYVIVGGYAVGFHGFPRYTGNIAFLIRRSEENAERLVEVMKDFGFGEMRVEACDFLRPNFIVEMGREPRKIQVLTDIDGVDFDECRASSLTYPCEGLNISFIGLEALLRNKVASGRPKDLIDVEALTKQKT